MANSAFTPGFTTVSLTTDVTGTLQAAQTPAYTGDVTKAAGSLVQSIAAGSIATSKLVNASANLVLAGPTSGTAAAPTFRALSALDLAPVLGAKVVTGGANYTVANATYTSVPFAASVFDTGSLHSNVTNNSRITIPTGYGGKWLLGASAYAAWTAGSGNIIMGIAINGSYVAYTTVLAGGPGAITAFESIAAGSFVECLVYQTSGATVTMVSNGNLTPLLWAQYVGP